MDSGTVVLSSVHRRKSTKRKSSKQPPKKKPIKIVYISNPMKVQASASEFRALVQELTGRDSEFPDDPSNFLAAENGGRHREVEIQGDASVTTAEQDPAAGEMDSNNSFVHDDELLFDEIFSSSPLIDNFSGLVQSAILYQSYETLL